jgi:CDP-paratose synthetase
MNILVTGAGGFIGKNLSLFLRKKSINFTCLVRSSKDCDFFTSEKIRYLSLNEFSLEQIFKDNAFDGIVHLATFFKVEHDHEDIKDLISSNIEFGSRLLDLCVSYKIGWFLNIGTFWQHMNGSVYEPVNLYSATKQAFEDIAKFYTSAFDLRVCTLKICDTYGPFDTRRKIFSIWDDAARNNTTIDMSKGEQLIDIVHVDKVIVSIITLAYALHRNQLNGSNLPSFYVSSNKKISLRELATEYEKTHNSKVRIKWGALPYRNREVFYPQCVGINMDKFQAYLQNMSETDE